MPSPPADQPVMDHVALASLRAWDNLIRYCFQIGARWLGGPTIDDDTPFYFCQLEFGGGAKLELLEPIDHPGSAFLNRFLHRNGPGPHHFTFKVPDIHKTMADVESAGYNLVGQRLDDPDWKEAFLHPKQSHGMVIQLAQQSSEAGWDDPGPLPPSPQPGPPTLDRVHHLVADLDAATELFTGPLAMTEVDRGDSEAGRFVTVTSGPFTVVLVTPQWDAGIQWMGDRPGRLVQLAITVADLHLVSDLRVVGDVIELPPDRNMGTRVLLQARERD